MGRLLSDGNINYTWSDNDRLISIKKSGVTTNYLYNADGLRTGKLSDSDTSYYLVDPTLPYGQVIAEYGSDTTFYVFGLQREVRVTESDTNYYVIDGQGSVRNLVDKNESITDSYSYDSYGNITESDGVTKNSFLYRGEQFDIESGNYYLRSRYYSPISASFISVDPFVGDVGNPITLNKFLYGNGNPVMFSDPSGNMGISGMMATININNILATISQPVYNFSAAKFQILIYLDDYISRAKGVSGGEITVLKQFPNGFVIRANEKTVSDPYYDRNYQQMYDDLKWFAKNNGIEFKRIHTKSKLLSSIKQKKYTSILSHGSKSGFILPSLLNSKKNRVQAKTINSIAGGSRYVYIAACNIYRNSKYPKWTNIFAAGEEYDILDGDKPDGSIEIRQLIKSIQDWHNKFGFGKVLNL